MGAYPANRPLVIPSEARDLEVAAPSGNRSLPSLGMTREAKQGTEVVKGN